MSHLPEPLVSLNGRLVPFREASVSIIDDGLVQGATVTERIRTFRHRPFRLKEHLDRLRQSLSMTGIAPASIVDTLPPLIDRIVEHNANLIADWQDLSIVIFITPGLNRSLVSGLSEIEPTVCVHSTPLPAPLWAAQATEGLRLITPTVQQVSSDTIDPRIKHRSRLHWFLADREVIQNDRQGVALLLNERGHVTETSTGNLIILDGERLLTPRPECVLNGISQRVVQELAATRGIETAIVDLTPSNVLAAQEAFLSSTGYCLLPVATLNGQSIGDRRPGPLYQRLIGDWSASVDVDILAQFQRAAEERPR